MQTQTYPDFFDEMDSRLAQKPQATENVPDGQYLCEIKNAFFRPEIDNGYDTKKPGLAFYELEVVKGPEQGRIIKKFANLRRDPVSGRIYTGAIIAMRQDLEALGIDCPSRELEARMAGIIGRYINVEAVTEGKYQQLKLSPSQEQPEPTQTADQDTNRAAYVSDFGSDDIDDDTPF